MAGCAEALPRPDREVRRVRVPGWYEGLLLALAAFRTFKLLATDTILDWPRNRSYEQVFHWWGPKAKLYWQEFLECPWCTGFWMSLGWWGAWQLWPHGSLVAAVPMALSALVGTLAWFTS